MSTSTPPSRTVVAVSVIIAIACGALVATQSRINGELGRQLGDGYAAALLSFGSGLVLLCVAMLFWKPGRRGLSTVLVALRTRTIPWWYVCGGAAGALLVLSQGLTAALLGVALFTVATVCGQTISGLLLDRRGLGTMAPKAVTWTRLAGSALALVAVAWSVSSQIVGSIPLWMLVMPFIAGLGIGWQQAVNGQVRGIAESALTATFVNFVVGTTVLLIALLVHVGVAGLHLHFPSSPLLYLGGAIGVVFIAGAAILVRITGVLLLGLSTVAGQLSASLVLDVVAPVSGHVVAWTTVAGTLLTLVAVGIAAVPSRAVRARSESLVR
jgi:transporter family-2 protein